MNYQTDHTAQYLHVELLQKHDILSSAVLNGGYCQPRNLLNFKVDENFLGKKAVFESPHVSLQRFSDEQSWGGQTVAMMTSASMNSYRFCRRESEGIYIDIHLTAGLSNARRAGDRAGYRQIGDLPQETGTINTIILTNAALTPAALCEALVIATEAKAACLQDNNILSSVSGKLATGTGTDAICIGGLCSGKKVEFCGKHTLFGELLADGLMVALTSAINWKFTTSSWRQ